jgi:hypothetical protein
VDNPQTGDGPDMRRCSRCGRYFKSRMGADDHILMKHKGIGQRVSVRRPDDDPSMADLVVDAEIARACGEPVDPLIAEMFDI